jgi:aspartate aminotransferase
VPTLAAEGFEIRADPLLAALSERTRVVLINSPCNPTGGIMQAAELRRLVCICAERDIAVLSDETYERLVYDGRQPVSAAALAAEFPETVIVVGSFSKTYAMTGWRLGYVLGPDALIRKVSAFQTHMTSNPTSFAMPGALAALRGAEEQVREMVREFQWRRDYLVARLLEIPGVQCAAPAGAFYVFPKVSALYAEGRGGSVEFSEMLLEQAGLAVVPGIAFGDDQHIRLSFTCSRERLRLGMDRMQALLAG